MQRNSQRILELQTKVNPFAQLLRKLLLGFIAVGFLMLAAFGFTSWDKENQDMQRNLAIQAGFAEKNSQAVLDNIGISMELLGQLLTKLDYIKHPDLAHSALMEFQSLHPEILSVTLVSPTGVALLSTNTAKGGALPDYRQDAAYLLDFLFDLNNTYSYSTGRNQFDKDFKKWHFPFRHTVQDNQGNPQFVIQAAISEDSAGFLWSDLPLYPESRVGLIRNDGYIQLLWPSSETAQAFSKPQTVR